MTTRTVLLDRIADVEGQLVELRQRTVELEDDLRDAKRALAALGEPQSNERRKQHEHAGRSARDCTLIILATIPPSEVSSGGLTLGEVREALVAFDHPQKIDAVRTALWRLSQVGLVAKNDNDTYSLSAEGVDEYERVVASRVSGRRRLPK